MHMSDALISPIVGAVMLTTTAGIIAYSAKKINKDLDEKKIPLMGVMGAFIFAAQMINFAIPGTGSSGHIGGGMLLAILLGSNAGFLTMAAVLLIQALFFGDGGLLAYGANVFNLGFYTAFIAYPLIYKPLVRKGLTVKSITIASILSTIAGLQLGAFSVVVETFLSDKTLIPFAAFILVMQPIHLAIGVIEGLITMAVIVFILKAKPEILRETNTSTKKTSVSYKKIILIFATAVIIIGGFFSWFASENPDGLEWSISKVTVEENNDAEDSILSDIQEKTAFLPDYGFKGSESTDLTEKAGTSVSGILGGLITLVLTMLIGIFTTLIKKKRQKNS